MPPKAPRYVTAAMGNEWRGWKDILQLAETDPEYRNRKRVLGLIIGLLGPARALERMQLRKRLQATRIDPAPLFIVGHWRSGTTFLHNLIATDARFGYLTNVQALFPHSFMSNGLIRWIAKVVMPPTRPMDSMKINLYTPQEEELALLNYGTNSFYHAWTYPRETDRIYTQSIALEDPQERQMWKLTFARLLTKISLHQEGRPLVLKNPAHTGRIPVLLEMFPRARFIHIHRDPKTVYGSTKKLYQRALPFFQLQSISGPEMRASILKTYRRLMQSYLRDRSAIPAGQLIEVKYEDFVNDPLAGLEQIYEKLNLFPIGPAMSGFQAHTQKTKSHRVGKYEFSEEEEAMLAEALDFVPGHWHA